MKMYKDGGQITIAGLTTKEAACLQHGLFLLDNTWRGEEKGEVIDFGEFSDDPSWPQEMNRLQVTNGDVQVFSGNFAEQYGKHVNKIQRLEDLTISEDGALKEDLEKQAHQVA